RAAVVRGSALVRLSRAVGDVRRSSGAVRHRRRLRRVRALAPGREAFRHHQEAAQRRHGHAARGQRVMSTVMSPPLGTTGIDEDAAAGTSPARTTAVNSTMESTSTLREDSTQKDAVKKATQDIRKAAEEAAEEVP